MSLSSDNPDRTRNIVALVIGAVFLVAVIVGGYVLLTLAGKDTDRFYSFLTLLVTTLIPSTLTLWRAHSGATMTKQVRDDVQDVKHAVNGNLTTTVQNAVRDGLAEQNADGMSLPAGRYDRRSRQGE